MTLLASASAGNFAPALLIGRPIDPRAIRGKREQAPGAFFSMNDLDWARERAAYLQRARLRAGADFDTVVELFRGRYYVGHDWFEEGRASAQTLHRISHELAEDAAFPDGPSACPRTSGALEAHENDIQVLQELNDRRGRGVRDGGPRPNTYEAQELTDLLQTAAGDRPLRPLDGAVWAPIRLHPWTSSHKAES